MANPLAKALLMQQAQAELLGQMQQPLGDPADFTNKYNTPLTEKEMAKYKTWLSNLPPEQRSTYDYDLQGAFKAGAGRSEDSGHFPDKFKKPNHPTFSDQSQYSGQEGYVGGQWEDIPRPIPQAQQWAFTPGVSPTRQPLIDPEDLKAYFAQAEKGNVLKVK